MFLRSISVCLGANLLQGKLFTLGGPEICNVEAYMVCLCDAAAQTCCLTSRPSRRMAAACASTA